MIALVLTALNLGSGLVKSLTNDVNSFTYMESAPRTAEPNVFMEVPLMARAGSPRISCGAHCVSAGQCVGMEVCGGELCRLWNGSFQTNVTFSSTSAIDCHRYSKNSQSGPNIDITTAVVTNEPTTPVLAGSSDATTVALPTTT
uniref:Apple domain-containing protein n=1 Tax=Magallana gigas TaxID=29159 RepID=A0A8W8MCH8_MAGGI